ncbi:MAG: DNA internalization-related competence protein ComEC/Rec2, partial [Gemmatimonadaceae bacterium]
HCSTHLVNRRTLSSLVATMPLVAAAYLAFVGGVLAQMAGVGPAVVVACVAGIPIAALRRAVVTSALAALALAGVLLARAEAARVGDCRGAALGASRWTVRLGDDARPGVSIRGRVVDGGCDLPVGLSVGEGEAPGGAVVAVRGLALPAEGGLALRVIRASVRMQAPPGWLDRSRSRARARVHVLFGADHALPAALLLADTEGITPEIRQRFSDAGLIHVLAISGLHIGLVAGAIELLARAFRLPRRAAAVVAAAGALAYVGLLGFPPAALRSGSMLAAIALSRARQRPTSAWAVLAVGAAIPLVSSVRVAASLGYQLSVIGVAALLAAGALARRWSVLAGRHDWRGSLGRAMLASTAATAASAPIVAWHFGRLSLVGPLANIVASPVVAFLQPLLFLALVLAPAPPAAALAADAARPVLHLFDAVAAGAAALPGASVPVAPTLVGAACLGLAMAALLVACVATFPGRALVTAAASLTMAIWLPVTRRDTGRLELHLIDVGQGDAIALRTPAGRWLLVDAGRVWRGGDAGRRTVLPYLRRRGGPLAAFILSHPHADHVGGAASVLRTMRPAEYWDAGYPVGGDAYGRSLAEAADRRIDWRRVHPRDSLLVDGVMVRFLAPDSTWAAGLPDANSASTVALVSYGAVRILLTGDAEAAEEEWLLARYGAEALRADVLKVAHHGSRTSTTPRFLGAVRPRLALVSVGLGNDYGHPDQDVMARLAAVGALVLRTDQLGAVVVRTDGQTLDVETAGDRWSLPGSSPP